MKTGWHPRELEEFDQTLWATIMANGGVTVRQMQPGDLAVVESLRQRENWNQTAKDLERFLIYEPEGCFVACWDGVPVGTVTTTAYGQELGWIGMMLVHSDYRRRGIASVLIQRSVDSLREKKVASIKLDATPAGEPVYARLGFQPEWTFQRWERPGATAPAVPISESASFQPTANDAAIFGADRSAWLKLLAKDSLIIQRDNAFGMMRSGARAAYLGPIIAEEPRAAAEIVRELVETVEGTIFWDVPGPNAEAVRLAERLGFRPVRQLLRMWLDRPCPGDVSRQYAIADPATG